MSNDTLFKLLVTLIFVAIPGVIAYQMVTSTTDCEKATTAYTAEIRKSPNSAISKIAENEMHATCKAMGIQAEAYMKAAMGGK